MALVKPLKPDPVLNAQLNRLRRMLRGSAEPARVSLLCGGLQKHVLSWSQHHPLLQIARLVVFPSTERKEGLPKTRNAWALSSSRQSR